MTEITYPHDQLVKTAMSDLRVARDFFKAHLPKDLLLQIDLDNLAVQQRAHINEIRQNSEVDLLYKTTIGEHPGYLYLLVEHQSTPDKLMPLRILKYTCNIMDFHQKTNKDRKLPLVIPMVLYHAERPYSYSTDLKDLIQAPSELINKYFLKPFQLIDLGRIEDEELRKHAWAGAMEFVLKHIFARDLLPYVKYIIDTLSMIANKGGREYVCILLEYLYSQGNLSNKDEFFQLVNKKVSNDIGGKIMTLAEISKEEGRQEGIQEIIKKMVKKGIDLNLVAEVTGLPVSKIKELSQ